MSVPQPPSMLPPKLRRVQILLSEAAALTKQVREDLGNRDSGLAPGVSEVLQLLDEHGPTSVPQLGRLRNTSRQNIQVLVNRLVKDGAVRFLENPAHKRSPLVQLTEQGRALPSKARAAETQVLERLAVLFSGEDVDHATAVLSAFRMKLQKDARAGARPKGMPKPVTNPQPSEEEMPVSLL